MCVKLSPPVDRPFYVPSLIILVLILIFLFIITLEPAIIEILFDTIYCDSDDEDKKTDKDQTGTGKDKGKGIEDDGSANAEVQDKGDVPDNKSNSEEEE